MELGVYYTMHKKITKNPLNYFLLIVKKFLNVKRARAKKLEGGAKHPSPACVGLKVPILHNLFWRDSLNSKVINILNGFCKFYGIGKVSNFYWLSSIVLVSTEYSAKSY